MLFKTILGNVNELGCEKLEYETITISGEFLHEKSISVKSDMDNEYGIDLSGCVCSLKDGSIFYKNDKKIIVLKVV